MKITRIFPVVLALLLVSPVFAQQKNTFKPQKAVLATINANLADADAQYKYMATQLKPQEFPKTFHPETGKMETSNSGWWCSGFYPGTLLELYAQNHDEALKTEANRIMGVLAKEQYNTHTHDLGFMMYCSFGTANKLRPKPEYKQILINSAKSLSTSFNPKVGCIKSWDSKPSDFLVIIDNMMNLELLFWATRETGDSSFYKIAVTHANTTIKNHYRPDFSSYHVINYNSETGAVKEKKTAQGFANESAWARGQAWGLYGFTVMYRETKDKKYLDQAKTSRSSCSIIQICRPIKYRTGILTRQTFQAPCAMHLLRLLCPRLCWNFAGIPIRPMPKTILKRLKLSSKRSHLQPTKQSPKPMAALFCSTAWAISRRGQK
jgi:unsaturated chondroitin disaccharide hydrolase